MQVSSIGNGKRFNEEMNYEELQAYIQYCRELGWELVGHVEDDTQKLWRFQREQGKEVVTLEITCV